MGEFTAAVQDYRGVLHGYVRKRLQAPHDAEDVVQEALLRFYSRGSVAELTAPVGYLLRIAANLLADRGRAHCRRMVAFEAVHEAELAVDPDQEHGRHLSDLERAYADALVELTPRCRAVFESRRHAGISTPEVARRMSISPRMVQKYMAQAQAHLAERLQLFGPDVPVAWQNRAAPVRSMGRQTS